MSISLPAIRRDFSSSSLLLPFSTLFISVASSSSSFALYGDAQRKILWSTTPTIIRCKCVPEAPQCPPNVELHNCAQRMRSWGTKPAHRNVELLNCALSNACQHQEWPPRNAGTSANCAAGAATSPAPTSRSSFVNTNWLGWRNVCTRGPASSTAQPPETAPPCVQRSNFPNVTHPVRRSHSVLILEHDTLVTSANTGSTTGSHVIVQYFSSPPKCHSFYATRRKSVVDNDRVRPGLVELQSLSLSTLQIDPIHRVLMYLPLLPISSNSWLCQVKLRLPVFPYVHGVYCCKEHCLPPFLCVSSTCDQTWSCDGAQVGRASNVVDVLSKVIW